MSAYGVAVAVGKRAVYVQLRFSVIDRNVAEQREYFDLLADLDRLIALLIEIVKSNRRVLKTAQAFKERGHHILFLGKTLHLGHHVVARFENQHETPRNFTRTK